MQLFWLKRMLAGLTDALGINALLLGRLNRAHANDYIRVVNYHATPEACAVSFEKQLLWYKRRFQNAGLPVLAAFLDGKKAFRDKPGLLLTFDDGLKDNYDVAKPLLDKHGFTGCFMVSPDLVDTEGYMRREELLALLRDGHFLGCHTATHHRMEALDTDAVLQYEICSAKAKLEAIVQSPIDAFCWCGGEEAHYTPQAARRIASASYRYSFLTNSCPVTRETNRLAIERTNVDALWPLPLARFQLCGFLDMKTRKKRNRVEKLVLDASGEGR